MKRAVARIKDSCSALFRRPRSVETGVLEGIRAIAANGGAGDQQPAFKTAITRIKNSCYRICILRLTDPRTLARGSIGAPVGHVPKNGGVFAVRNQEGDGERKTPSSELILAQTLDAVSEPCESFGGGGLQCDPPGQCILLRCRCVLLPSSLH